MRDYARTARLLRAKAADPAVSGSERESLLAKAAELESRDRDSKSSAADNATVTSRDGFTRSHEYWEGYIRNLAENQWQWNEKYYDKDGNLKPGYDGMEDITDDLYQYSDSEYDYERYDDAE